MEKTLKFNSQVATSRVQSERLLALGLKKETADCYYWQECDQYGDPNGKWHLDILNDDTREHFEYLLNHFGICLHIEDALFIPAWSLHRLICMLPEEIVTDGYRYNLCIDNDSICHFEYSACTYEHFVRCENLYDAIVGYIEWLIKDGYFNKEYLEV